MEKPIITKYIKDIKSASEQGRLVIFVGAGVSNNSGIPVWSTLIKAMKDDLPGFAENVTDDLKLAQIYKTTYPTKFVEKVREVLRHDKVIPNPIHDAILDLHPAYIITTNYDDLLEQSFSKRYEQYSVIRADEDLPSCNSNKLLIKMHGDFEKGNIVLAEQDYYDYSRNFPLVRSYVMSLFASKVILFVGFSFDDINLKYILRNLQVILQKKMQPVYLLTADDMKYEQLKYLENKGINPLCMTTQMINEAEESLSMSLGEQPKTLTNPRGKILYRQLRLIRNFCEQQDPLINIVVSLSKYDDEFGVYGEYLKYIVPDYIQPLWHQRYNKLNIEETWFQSFCKKDKSFNDILTLYKKYQNIYSQVMSIAFKNQIYYIGSGYNNLLFNNIRYNRWAQYTEIDGINEFYRMNLLKVYDRIIFLSSQAISLTRKDLELPYLYYKIGKYEEAFCRYFELVDIFWKKKKFILYMICRVNMRALANALIHSSKASIDNRGRASEICKTELAEILNELPLDKGIRKIFSDLISYKMLLSKVENTSKICHEIEKQRENAKNGGCSWNNYAQELLYNFSSLVDFFNTNYIISDSFEYTRKAFCNIARGLMNSLMIQGDVFGNSRIKSIKTEMVMLFLFHLRKNELQDILRREVGQDVPIDDDARKYIIGIIDNLVEYTKSELNRTTKYFEKNNISGIIFNLCFLLCYLPKECIPTKGLFFLIAEYMRLCDEKDYVDIIGTLVCKREPTTEEAEQIINLYMVPLSTLENNPWLLSHLTKILAKNGKTLNVGKEFSQYKNLDIVSLAALRPALNADRQKELDEYVKSSINNLYEALVIEMNFDCHFFDKPLLEKLINDFLSKGLDENEMDICYQLKNLYQKEQYAQYRPLIESVITKKKVLAFFMDPIANVVDMEAYWILGLDDEQIRDLIKVKGVMAKIDVFCRITYERIGKQVQERIWKALLVE